MKNTLALFTLPEEKMGHKNAVVMEFHISLKARDLYQFVEGFSEKYGMA